MPLIRIPFKGGFNKQITQSEAANQWTDGDFVRFRYGEPEKIVVGNKLYQQLYPEWQEPHIYGLTEMVQNT